MPVFSLVSNLYQKSLRLLSHRWPKLSYIVHKSVHGFCYPFEFSCLKLLDRLVSCEVQIPNNPIRSYKLHLFNNANHNRLCKFVNETINLPELVSRDRLVVSLELVFRVLRCFPICWSRRVHREIDSCLFRI